MHTTTFTANRSSYMSKVYCSFPGQVCVYDLNSTGVLPQITVNLENELVDASTQNTTCGNGYARMASITQTGPPTGMKYESIARLTTGTESSCDNATGSLIVSASTNHKTLSIVINAGTDYDQTHGNAAYDFSFRGEDPKEYVQAKSTRAAAKSSDAILAAHLADYRALSSQFQLVLPDTASSSGLETAAVLARYSANGTGDPSLEATLFEYGRHLFISSSREDSLPPNLQGRWATGLYAA